MIHGAYGHLIWSALQLGQWYKMLSMAKKEEDSDSDGVRALRLRIMNVRRRWFTMLRVFRCATVEKLGTRLSKISVVELINSTFLNKLCFFGGRLHLR